MPRGGRKSGSVGYHAAMLFLVALAVRALARLVVGSRRDHRSKDLEILILRHQVRVLRRKNPHLTLRPLDRTLLAAASRVLPRDRWASFMVTPATLLRWHRELVRRKWTYGRAQKPGRPPLDPEVRELILRLARENPRWGCVRIQGELRKLGIRVAATTIRMLLRRTSLGPAPRRRGPTWSQFLRSQADGVIACDFLHHRDRVASDPVRPGVHRARDPADPPHRLHRPPRFRMGDPAGEEPGDGPG